MRVSVGLLVLLLIAGPSHSPAQDLKAWGITLGGVRAEQLWEYVATFNNGERDTNPLWGLEAGAYVEFSITRNVGFSAELRYVRRGRTFSIMGTVLADNPQGYIDVGPIEISQRSHYISIPLLVQVSVGSDHCSPFVAFGPRCEYLVSHTASTVYDQLRHWDFGGTAAAGVHYSPGIAPSFFLEIYYDFNLTDSFKNYVLTVNNRALGMMIGVSL